MLKFIVDGLYTCDTDLPMAKDRAGNLNNLMEIFFDMSPSGSVSMSSSIRKGFHQSTGRQALKHNDKNRIAKII